MYSHDKRQRKHTKLKMNARSKACILSRGITLSNAKIDFKIMKYLCCAQHVCYLIDTHFNSFIIHPAVLCLMFRCLPDIVGQVYCSLECFAFYDKYVMHEKWAGNNPCKVLNIRLVTIYGHE